MRSVPVSGMIVPAAAQTAIESAWVMGGSRAVFVIATFAALAAGSCGARANQPPTPVEPAIAWRQLGLWSGRGNLQTESFTSDTGALRVRWETTPQAGDAASATHGAFRVTAHSAISGRPLQEAVDHTGVGSGVGYVQQDPHVFYIVVDASHVNWKITVDEAVVYP
jgi:hypothetical protein